MSIDGRFSRLAAFSVELSVYARVLEVARWGGVPDVGPARRQYASKLANLIFHRSRLNVCTGKNLHLPHVWAKSWIYLQEQRQVGAV